MNANDHFSGACYEVWKRGGNPDRLIFDRAEHDFYNGKDPEYTAQREIKRQIKPKNDENEDILYRGLSGLFQCKCGYKTTQSLSWCFHADSCPFPG